jgi:hypothetical protein
MIETVSDSSDCAWLASLAAMAARSFLRLVRKRVRLAVLTALRRAFWRSRFSADLWFGINFKLSFSAYL